MKKIMLLISMLVFLLTSICAQEQENAKREHLDFKGVEINGPLSTFVSKLEEKGFKKEKEWGSDAVIMEGEFASKQTTVYILASADTKTVWKVCAQLPKIDTWSSLKLEYFKYKELYTQKYGKPESFEFFSKPYYEGDGYETQALKKEKCTYSSYFKTNVGYVSIAISKYNCIEISYEDSKNNELRKIEQEKNILDEI